MKRKQFHLSSVEEEILQRLSKESGRSEAEIVREAINEYGKKRMKSDNPLLKMAEEAEEVSVSIGDLSEKHDQYLTEIVENER